MRSRNNDKKVEEFVLDYPQKIFIVGWFERLKTSEVYLRDCTLFSDPLPLLLLLPGVKQRGTSGGDCQKSEKKSRGAFSYANDPTIFEAMGGKSSQGGDSHVEPRSSDSRQSTLLLKVQDVATAHLINNLRRKLNAFVGAVLSKGLSGNLSSPVKGEVGAVFNGLESILEQSYSLYLTDDGLHGGSGRQINDPDVLEVMHLHQSAHCEVLDPNKDDNSADRDDEMDLDDGGDDSYQKWSGRDGNGNSWRGDRGRASKRGRGRSWGRHGGARRDKGSRW